ncbi:sensor histidine kinase [Desulfovibrio litoralis]|uniref:histidine kinase n=1 Tax=Desulfovibrio litoralis DSM 11393 TaxID=1121455 RepID=A0A1M7SP31_9BACT|nr:ATP-binding protein [Desulfovibrio litoralis]SHN60220.1 two-component system, OmpR family, phosphate regulon sensor histidine kinase PhoR [Desulfovibrio litoralis DSM 11393]
MFRKIKNQLKNQSVSFLLIILSTLALIGILTALHSLLYKSLVKEEIDQALNQVKLLGILTKQSPELLKEQNLIRINQESNVRISHIGENGQMLADSSLPENTVKGIDNHSDRLEFILAQQNGVGSSVRTSATSGIETIYAITRLYDNSFLRLAVPLSTVQEKLESHFKLLGLLIIITFLVTFLFFFIRSHKLKKNLQNLETMILNISEGNYKQTISSIQIPEFYPLIRAVRIIAKGIQKNMHTLQNQNSQLKSIFDGLQEAIIILDENGNVTAHNSKLHNFFPETKHYLNKQLIEIIPLPELQAAGEEMLKQTQSVTLNFNYETLNNKQLLIQLYTAEEATNLVKLIVIIDDITTKLQLERTQKDFVANVSHELRTPLTTIKGYAETLYHNECEQDVIKSFSQKIIKNSLFLNNLIEDLLVLAKFENKNQTIETKRVSFMDCLNNAKQLLGSQTTKNIIETTAENSTTCYVLANENLLVQAIRNLLENAYRHSPDHASILINIYKEDTYCVLAVSDFGEGIPKKEQTRIFERFYKTEKSKHHQSTGLGLAITKQIIEKFNGEILVESPSKLANTTFYIKLPTQE